MTATTAAAAAAAAATTAATAAAVATARGMTTTAAAAVIAWHLKWISKKNLQQRVDDHNQTVEWRCVVPPFSAGLPCRRCRHLQLDSDAGLWCVC
jgi:hypothetical protein